MTIDMLTAIATLQLTGVILFELFVFSRRRDMTVLGRPKGLVVAFPISRRVEDVQDVREAA